MTEGPNKSGETVAEFKKRQILPGDHSKTRMTEAIPLCSIDMYDDTDDISKDGNDQNLEKILETAGSKRKGSFRGSLFAGCTNHAAEERAIDDSSIMMVDRVPDPERTVLSSSVTKIVVEHYLTSDMKIDVKL